MNLYGYCAGNPINFVDPNGHWVVSAGVEGGAAFALGLYLAIDANYDGKYLSVSASLGLLITTNVSGYVAGYFAYYPNKKNVNKVKGVGISVGVAFSAGAHISGGGSMEVSAKGSGFSAQVGAGASMVPIPSWQVKFGYTWTLKKWKLSKIKNGKKVIKKVKGKKTVTITKRAKYTNIRVIPIKKTIRIYNNKEVKIY